jgi:Fe-S oxidoreductase
VATLTGATAAGGDPAAAAGSPAAIATGCPFCRVMLSDGLTAQQADGQASESIEVLDVAQLLLESVRRDPDGARPTGT